MPGPVAFLFDLDGVLVDSASVVRAGWVRFARGRGVELTEDDIRDRLFGRRTLDALVEVFGLPPREAERLVAAGIDDKAADLEAGAPLPPIPGAPEFVLAARAEGIPCAVVTSAGPANL